MKQATFSQSSLEKTANLENSKAKITLISIFNTLLCVLFFALPLSESAKQITLYPLIALGFYIIWRQKLSFKLDMLGIFLIAYAGFFALSALINAQIKYMLDPIRSVGLFLVIYGLGVKNLRLNFVLYCLFGGYLIAFIMACYKVFFASSELFELKSIGYVNTSAIYSFFILSIFLCAFWWRLASRWLCIAAILLSFSGVVLSASRTCIYLLPLLFLLFGFFALNSSKNEIKFSWEHLFISLGVIVALALLAFLLTLLPHERIAYKISLGGDFLSTRLYIFGSAIYTWLEYPFFGIGGAEFLNVDNSIWYPNSPEPHAPHAHNTILHLLSTTGIFSALCYIIFCLFALVKFFKARKSALGLCALLILVLGNIIGLVELQFHSENLLLTMFIFALACSCFKGQKV
nr:O-antigen ligase family protein [uncultured Campylobacter sp.]